jgi:hypothetical protein
VRPGLLSREEIARRLASARWNCVKVRDFTRHSTWRTEHGLHFSVPHECTEAEFQAVIEDVIKYGRRRNI